MSMCHETRCFRIRLKPNSLERVRHWALALNETRREEAMATLRDETVLMEAYFLDEAPDGDFLIAVMKAESFERASRAAASSTHPIDRFHADFKRDTWQSTEQLETLVDLARL